jgi:hypothetical protein
LDTIPFNLTLDTPCCTLRIVSEGDVPFVWSASRFPGFTDGMAWNPPADQQELIEVNRKNLEAWRSGQAFTFTVVLKATQLPVGRIAIYAEPPKEMSGVLVSGYIQSNGDTASLWRLPKQSSSLAFAARR